MRVAIRRANTESTSSWKCQQQKQSTFDCSKKSKHGFYTKSHQVSHPFISLTDLCSKTAMLWFPLVHAAGLDTILSRRLQALLDAGKHIAPYQTTSSVLY